MIYFYDEVLAPFKLATENDRHILLNALENTPDFFEIESAEILDMTEYGAKVQFSLMKNAFEPNYFVVTKKPERFVNMVPSNKIICV